MDTNRIKAASRHFARRRATSLPPSPARLIAGALARCWAALAHRVRRWSAVVTPTSSENHVLTIVLINSAYFKIVRGGAHTIVYIPALDDNVHGNRFNNVMTMYNVHGMCFHRSGQRTLAPPVAHRDGQPSTRPSVTRAAAGQRRGRQWQGSGGAAAGQRRGRQRQGFPGFPSATAAAAQQQQQPENTSVSRQVSPSPRLCVRA